MQRGVPPFAKGDILHALFVPVLPRTRPKDLPRDVRRIDAATLLEVSGGDSE